MRSFYGNQYVYVRLPKKTPKFDLFSRVAAVGVAVYASAIIVAGKPAVQATADDLFLDSLQFATPSALMVETEIQLPGTTKHNLTVDELVDVFSKKYGKTRYQQNRLKALTHYLLLREQNYAGSTACGDNGKACGPMQFWEDTYKRNRKDMIRKGYVSDMGSRHDLEDSVETAIYMFSIGQEKQWGPVLREEIKI